jgi:hypothetical protein
VQLVASIRQENPGQTSSTLVGSDGKKYPSNQVSTVDTCTCDLEPDEDAFESALDQDVDDDLEAVDDLIRDNVADLDSQSPVRDYSREAKTGTSVSYALRGASTFSL